MCQTWAQKHCSNLSIVPYQFQPSSALGSCFQTRRQSQRWRSWRLLLDNLILHSGSRLYFGDIPIILCPKTKPSYHHIWLTQDGSGGRHNPMGACAGSSFTEISAGASFTELEEAADSTALEACAGSSFLRVGFSVALEQLQESLHWAMFQPPVARTCRHIGSALAQVARVVEIELSAPSRNAQHRSWLWGACPARPVEHSTAKPESPLGTKWCPSHRPTCFGPLWTKPSARSKRNTFPSTIKEHINWLSRSNQTDYKRLQLTQ